MRTSVAIALLVGLQASGADAESACPFHERFFSFDGSYHACANGHIDGSCARFLGEFRSLIPTYDCRRSFDTGPVPALWLAEAALEDYVRLAFKLAKREDSFSNPEYVSVAREARALVVSKEFRSVLDGSLAEEYLPVSESLARETEEGAK